MLANEIDLGRIVSGTVRNHETFGAQIERNEKLAEQLEDALARIDQRISGRAQGGGTGVPGVPVAAPTLTLSAEYTGVTLERCVELAQRIAGDVGALD